MSFARKMHTRVIAEGIETREELRVLQSLGVPYGQGFLSPGRCRSATSSASPRSRSSRHSV